MRPSDASSRAVLASNHDELAPIYSSADAFVFPGADLCDARMMDVSADDTVDAESLCLRDESGFKRADEIDRILDLEFRPGLERPIVESEQSSDAIKPGV